MTLSAYTRLTSFNPAARDFEDLPRVSIVVACRNEERFIARCLDSILLSDYPQDKLEILVVDGCSTDSTRKLLQQYCKRNRSIRVLDNQQRSTPVAFNIGVRNARGELIMIMSAHATYESSAIRKCVLHSREYGVDNVGGICKIQARQDGLLADAIVIALSHPFGVGGALYRTTRDTGLRRVDTAAFGCYRRDVFDRIGTYNERLLRNQDLEFNLRLKKAGGATLLAPDVVIHYAARTDIKNLFRHSFQDGLWAIVSFAYSTVIPVSWRHLVPCVFVGALIGSAAATLVIRPAAYVFLAVVSAYTCANLIASISATVKQRRPALLVALPAVFTLLHVSYGFGSIWGWVTLARSGGWRQFVTLLWTHLVGQKREAACPQVAK